MTEEQRPPLLTPPSPKKRLVTPAKWAEVERAWESGDYADMDTLSKKFGIPVKQMRYRFSEKKVRRGAAIEDYNRKIQQELDKKAAEDAKLVAERIADTREEHYKMAAGIAKLTWSEILTAKQAGSAMSSVKGNLASLESAMKVLKMAREERFAVLGLDREETQEEDNALPELLVNELTQEQIDDMRARDVASQDDDGIDLSEPSVQEIQHDGPEDLDDDIEEFIEGES